jgi:FkbM family methyltransferase
VTRTLKDLTEEFRTGRLARDDFWLAMQARHLELRQYQALVAGTQLASIQIHAAELRILTAEGIAMVWEPEDLRSAPNVLVNYGIYEEEESPFLLGAATGAQVVFDVGANVGFYSLHWISRLAPGGTVHAFEPVPGTFAKLARNVEINGLRGAIRTNDFGLGDEAKTLSIFVPGFSGSGAASIKNQHPQETSVEVEARIETLDRYFPVTGLKQLDLIKVDVEGAELLVLKGGRETLARHRPLLFLELLRKWSKPFGYHPNEVIAMLGAMGYLCFAVDGGRLVPFTTMTDETVQTNFFFADPAKHRAWLETYVSV